MRDEVLEVIDGEPRPWPYAAALKHVSDERSGKVSHASARMYWTVGVDEIPYKSIQLASTALGKKTSCSE